MTKCFKLENGYEFVASKDGVNGEVWGQLWLNDTFIECGYYRTSDFIKALMIALSNNNVKSGGLYV